MPSDCISYQESGYFTPLIVDYLNQSPEVESLYNHFPNLEGFKAQIAEKKQQFPLAHRATLVEELKKQYAKLNATESLSNIELLASENTFTITTGHQLNLFTGPLYFLYKIISTINLCKELKINFPEYNFVPVYWMATEDHDFEEINFFNYKGKKVRWNAEVSGAVGRQSTSGLKDVYEVFAQEIGHSQNAEQIKKWFKEAYLKHDNLADATRYLAHQLFGSYGLVILDADVPALKQIFVPYIQKELTEQTTHQQVLQTNELLKDYLVQVNPRKINLFYLEDSLRERIILEDNQYKVNDTELIFTQSEILSEVKHHPEKFSPNVLLRPLYQEVILPNLCYIGGGGELAYWLQLKANFENFGVTFPILLLRNSVLLVTEKQAQKSDNLKLSWQDLFKNQHELINIKTKEISEFPIDLSIQKDHLSTQFHYLHKLAEKTDASFSGAVKAQEAKQIKGLENLEKRLLKAQKRKHKDQLERIILLQNELFPGKSLQERQLNFSEFYIEFGNQLIENLFEKLHPLNDNFTVVKL
ncbi:bacillithiol biosynthesis cysteine-adding enzyme BshC [Flavobacterium sp. CYK-55]|uniref:bacillithiol biosynthesis cysteine-adding enzyme BshC n=1 Tax=Flavobacterium sp. CYK-55 TaxID=2835529 RepID=UPI001BCFF184|nr:bacillithiol biosynthesis cysteine-adding enzyme BshC [Flavobacterium sp. CYK-55]MBS7786262.1 bacillithiol biosynthesis cysteine-adding enzyme BshC [Flavobacterium sp. CYK-55]